MSSSTTSEGNSLRGSLKRGTSVAGWRAIASIVARRSMRPRALASWRRLCTGASGRGSSSAMRLASSNSAVVIDSKSALCRRSRSEKVKVVSYSISSSLPGSGFLGAALARGGASASASRFGRLGGSRMPRPCTFGSSKAIICSSSFGSRQNVAKAASKISCCSCRSSITAESAACTSSRRSSPTASIASSAARTRSGPTGMPAARSTRAKWATLSANTGAARLAQFRKQSRHLVALHLDDVVAMLEEHAERVLDARRIEAHCVQGEERVGPVDRLGDPRRLEEIELAHPLHERDDLGGQPRVRPRRTDADDLELASDVGIVDPVIEAAALQRIVDLARPVARDDDDRRRRRARPDRAELGNRQLV